MQLIDQSPETLESLRQQYQSQFEALQAKNLKLDLTRGKPGSEQLDLSKALDGILEGNFTSGQGVDLRNYGGLDGLDEAKALFAPILGVSPSDVLIGGNSSLTLMFQYLSLAHHFGAQGPGTAWNAEGPVKFICLVPGYDRHFTICEYLGIEMISVPLGDQGPDMDAITTLVQNDPSIKGIWCVPQYSNPTGISYSSEVIQRFAELPKVAGPHFRIMWDNAYAVHHLEGDTQVDCLLEKAKQVGTEDSVVMFASTSKVTLAGAGVALMASSASNLEHFKKYLSVQTIGPDKTNQMRHVQFFKDFTGLKAHMEKHTAILAPKFQAVFQKLADLDELGISHWAPVKGGYFVSVDTLEGLAEKVVSLCADCGVKLTPAGATFPYKKDPKNQNIRLAPSFPDVAAIEEAMDVFVCCVKLASVQKLLAD